MMFPPDQGPPQGPPPSPQSGGERDAIDLLKQMIDLANQYIQVEPDAEDQATMAKLLATLHQYLGKDQADTNKLLGNQSALARVVSKIGQ